MESNNSLLLAAIARARARPMDSLQCVTEPLRPIARRDDAITECLNRSVDLLSQLLSRLTDRRRRSTQYGAPLPPMHAHLARLAKPQIYTGALAGTGRVPIRRPQPFTDFFKLAARSTKPSQRR